MSEKHEFNIVTVTFPGQDASHNQTYIVLAGVSAEQIRAGDDTGVICLCIKPGSAECLARALNERFA